MAGSAPYDLAVVGSGAAAMSAGIAARQVGKRVVLIEHAEVGGTCVNVGCIPSKMMLAAASAHRAALAHPFRGVPTAAGPVDLGELSQQKDDLVASLRRKKYSDVAEAHGFEIVAGHARFLNRHDLEVDGHLVRADAYVIATGAGPATPDLPGLEAVDHLTSSTVLALTSVPESVVVVGAGYVGLELAQLLAHLGSRVSVVGCVAPRAEPELAALLGQMFVDDGIVVLQERAARVTQVGPDVVVTTESGERVAGRSLVIATGRRARTAGLGLDEAGVVLDAAGWVIVDAYQRTTNRRIFAAGDVSGAPQFAYVAAATGRVAAQNALLRGEGPIDAVDYTGLPAVLFTRPQLASAGLTENAADALDLKTTSRVLDLAEVPRAIVSGEIRGAVKMVAESDTGRVLGVHALADNAGEMMLAATYAITARMTVEEVARSWAPYLTMAESLRLVAQTFADRAPLSCCH
jgi:mercuric reductase